MTAEGVCNHEFSGTYFEWGDIEASGARRIRPFWSVQECKNCGETWREADEYYGDDMAEVHRKWTSREDIFPLRPTVTTDARRLTTAEMADYERLLADNSTGPEQTDMRKRDPQAYEIWLKTQLKHVPMPSEQKPDINGFREGDRVRLLVPFEGDDVSYDAGRTGTFLITNTAPANIRMAREVGLYEILIDGAGGLIGMIGGIEKIPGHIRVIYRGDNVTLVPD